MSAIHCFFCGGKECKYENWKLWSGGTYTGANAFDGIFSSWITDDILALQRPSTRLITEYDLLKKFAEKNICAIFNLQCAGEHASCGDGINPATGFSYSPQEFMNKNIAFFNFGWTDMETPDLELIQNMVSIMHQYQKQNKKIAIHCHAGLGRTGLSIACYLVAYFRMTSTQAIELVRSKRPLSVQTKKQVAFVGEFEEFTTSIRLIFPMPLQEKTFGEFIWNQRWLYEGEDLEQIRSIPKILHSVMTILQQRIKSDNTLIPSILAAFKKFEGHEKLDDHILEFESALNEHQWATINREQDSVFLLQSLLEWVIQLKEPLVLDTVLLKLNDIENFKDMMAILDKDVVETINYLAEFCRMETDAVSQVDVIEKLAVYISSHRYNLTFSKCKPAKTLTNYINAAKLNATKDKVMDTIKSRLKTTRTSPDTTKEISPERTSSGSAPQILDYEPPKLNKLVALLQYMTNNLTIDSKNRACWKGSNEPVNESPSWLTAHQFLTANPLGKQENLAILLKTNNPGFMTQIKALTASALSMVDPLMKRFTTQKVVNRSDPNLPAYSEPKIETAHMRHYTAPMQLDRPSSATTTPRVSTSYL